FLLQVHLPAWQCIDLSGYPSGLQSVCLLVQLVNLHVCLSGVSSGNLATWQCIWQCGNLAVHLAMHLAICLVVLHVDPSAYLAIWQCICSAACLVACQSAHWMHFWLLGN